MKNLKCEVYLPQSHLEEIVEALDQQGFLEVGNYREVYAITEVKGHWRPVGGAHPFLGEVDQAQQADEYKLEFQVALEEKEACLKILLQHHPYEEPIIRFIKME